MRVKCLGGVGPSTVALTYLAPCRPCHCLGRRPRPRRRPGLVVGDPALVPRLLRSTSQTPRRSLTTMPAMPPKTQRLPATAATPPKMKRRTTMTSTAQKCPMPALQLHPLWSCLLSAMAAAARCHLGLRGGRRRIFCTRRSNTRQSEGRSHIRCGCPGSNCSTWHTPIVPLLTWQVLRLRLPAPRQRRACRRRQMLRRRRLHRLLLLRPARRTCRLRHGPAPRRPQSNHGREQSCRQLPHLLLTGPLRARSPCCSDVPLNTCHEHTNTHARVW